MKLHVQVVAYALLSLLIACGSTMVSSTQSTTAPINIKFSEKQADGSYQFTLGTADSVGQASFCFANADHSACATTQILPVSASLSGSRKIFSMASAIALPDNTTVNILLMIDGQISRKLQLSQGSSGLNWKLVLMASDQADQNQWINAFDNARIKLKEMFMQRGVQETNIQELSLHPDKQGGNVKPTTNLNFRESVEAMKAGPNDACLIHMTSHGSSGSQNGGFNLGRARLNPVSVDNMLTIGCGDRPTVVMISACFSGLYLRDSFKIKKPNRIILTAAREDRTSFGCSSDETYVYWDTCLIENLPNSKTFSELADNIQSCIERKESGKGFTPSEPQKFIGDAVKDLALPGISSL